MTTPIARLVAQRLSNAPTPHKLSYSLPVYRRAGVGHGQSAEFHQAGVEVVGSRAPEKTQGLSPCSWRRFRAWAFVAPRDFVLVLGQTAFYEGYLRRVAPEAASGLLAALAAKDLVRVDESLTGLPDGRRGVQEIPRLVGPATDASIWRWPNVTRRARRWRRLRT